MQKQLTAKLIIQLSALSEKETDSCLRVFGKFGFDEGVAGHFTVRDPEHYEKFWVNPFGKSFKQMKMSDLILVDHEGASFTAAA